MGLNQNHIFPKTQMNFQYLNFFFILVCFIHEIDSVDLKN